MLIVPVASDGGVLLSTIVGISQVPIRTELAQLADPMDPYDLGHSLLGRHTYACALPTRGGLCDCMPSDPAGSAGPSVEPVDNRARRTGPGKTRTPGAGSGHQGS